MEKETLRIYTYIDGTNDVPFPSSTDQAFITEFTFSSQRMASATLTATLMYPSCLDKLWTNKEYVTLRGEKYWIRQIPTSSKDNENIEYKHELSFVPERDILNNMYFFDVVDTSLSEDGKYISNNTSVKFVGDVKEFASRLNSSMKYSCLTYSVVVDSGVTSDTFECAFENKSLFEAIQEIYNTFKVPFYFIGKVIHIGDAHSTIIKPFEYGKNKGLLSITKTNANYKIVNRCTGTGSSDNIPYYYPNDSADGTANYTTAIDSSYIQQMNVGTIMNWTNIDNSVVTLKRNITWLDNVAMNSSQLGFKLNGTTYDGIGWDNITIVGDSSGNNIVKQYTVECIMNGYANDKFHLSPNPKIYGEYISIGIEVYNPKTQERKSINSGEVYEYLLTATNTNESIFFYYTFTFANLGVNNGGNKVEVQEATWRVNTNYYAVQDYYYFIDNNNKTKKYEESGILFTNVASIPLDSTITFSGRKWIQPSSTLMPSIYRSSNGNERFYNAINNTYLDDKGNYITFENPYVNGDPKEMIVSFSDIRPSIKNITNASNVRIDQILDVAFDSDDNDNKNGDEYIHPYFYIKLPIYNGTNGFNLFDQALEGDSAVINMTSGNVSACAFTIQAIKQLSTGGQYVFQNPVQVDSNGNIVSGGQAEKINKDNIQPQQQNTAINSVWIAVKKDVETFGNIIPSSSQKIYPKAGDSYVITGIRMPKSYILAKEDELKKAIIKYMSENNSDKFNFSISLSKNYLKDNPTIFDSLSENVKINVIYNGDTIPLYVSTYTLKQDDNIFQSIELELKDTITITQNSIQNKISEVASQMQKNISTQVDRIDVYEEGKPYFLGKNDESIAKKPIHFENDVTFGESTSGNYKYDITKKGNAHLNSIGVDEAVTNYALVENYLKNEDFTSGFNGLGFSIYKDDNDKWNIEVDNMLVREEMRIYQMIIEKIKSVGGKLIISASSGKVKNVLSDSTYYTLYLEDTNTFVEGDYIKCQTISSSALKSYWVKVYSATANAITILKTEFTNQSVPSIGDELVLLGSQNSGRQSAITLSASDNGKPCLDIYNDIDSASLDGCLKTRLGYLDDVADDTMTPAGYGLYSDNVYLRGTFVLSNGNDVSSTITSIEAKQGQITLQVGNSQMDKPNLIVGGRNPLMMSGSTSNVIQTNNYNINNKIWARIGITNTSTWKAFYTINLPTSYVGKQICVSYDIYTTQTALNGKKAPCIWGGGTYASTNGIIQANQTTKAWAIFTLGSTTPYFVISGSGYIGDLYIRNVMVNEGNVPMPYKANVTEREDGYNYIANSKVALSGNASSGNLYGTTSSYSTEGLGTLGGKVVNLSFDVAWDSFVTDSDRSNDMGVNLFYKHGTSNAEIYAGITIPISTASGNGHYSRQDYIYADITTSIQPQIFIRANCNATISNVMLNIGDELPWRDSTDTTTKNLLATGINIEDKTITLTSNQTSFKDTNGNDIAVFNESGLTSSKVNCKNGNYVTCTINSNNDGTRKIFYPNSTKVLSEESLVFDETGDCTGMKTTYYKKDGSVSFVINESGSIVLSYSGWSHFQGYAQLGSAPVTPTSLDPLTASIFSRFDSNDTSVQNYWNRVCNDNKIGTPTVTDLQGTSWYSGYVWDIHAMETMPDIPDDDELYTTYGRGYTHYVDGDIADVGIGKWKVEKASGYGN